MRYLDGETGLDMERAARLRERLAALEDEVLRLRLENSMLRTQLENLGIRKTEEGLILTPDDTNLAILTPTGELKPATPNTLTLGSADNYLQDVKTANITIASEREMKAEILDVGDDELDIAMPRPKKFRRLGSGEYEIGFIADELSPILRRAGGYDLKALVAILAHKLSKISEKLR